MDKYTQFVNRLLEENMNNTISENDTSLRDQMEALDTEIFAAIDAKDKEAHIAALEKYAALRDKAIEKFGIDGPVHLIDPDLLGVYSDDYKDDAGFRPRGDHSFRDAVEFYPSGAYGKIVDDKFIAPPVVSYIEDQETVQGDTVGELQSILQKFPSEVEDLKNGGDFADELYDELFEYFMDSGEMPYEVAKARSGDPYEWIHNKLDELGVFDHVEDQEGALTR